MRALASQSVRISAVAFVFAASVPFLHAQTMPDGPDKDLFIRTCSKCHEIDRVMSQRQDLAGWHETIAKMQGYGLQAPDDDLKRINQFLATNLPADAIQKLNINTAARIDFEATLGLKRSVAAAVIDYRDKNGGFKSIDDLKNVPGIDPAVIDAKKSGLTLQ